MLQQVIFPVLGGLIAALVVTGISVSTFIYQQNRNDKIKRRGSRRMKDRSKSSQNDVGSDCGSSGSSDYWDCRSDFSRSKSSQNDVVSVCGSCGSSDYRDCTSDFLGEDFTCEYGTAGPDLLSMIDSELDGDFSNFSSAFNRMKLCLYEKEEKLLWRLAKACYLLSIHYIKGNQKKEGECYLDEGICHADQCISIFPEAWNGYKWKAALLGLSCFDKPDLKKVEIGEQVKGLLEKAIKLNREDGFLHYMLARFNFEVASLPWLKKKFLSQISQAFGEPTVEQCLESFKKAKKLGFTYRENEVFIAKCHIYLENTELALNLLKKARDFRSNGTELYDIDDEISTLLCQHS